MLQWLQSLLFGLICGFTEFLPVSSLPHEILLSRLFGISDFGGMLTVAVHIGALLTLFLQYRPQLSRIDRERKIAAEAPRRRKRQPDTATLLDLKLLRIAAIPMLLGYAAYPWVGDQGQRLWILGLGLIVNGIFLYLPQFMVRSNKTARHLTGVDSLFIGLFGALAVIPGISRTGILHSAAAMRGVDRQYGLQTALMLCIPALLIQLVFDFAAVFISATGITFFTVICSVTALAASFLSSYFSIIFIRFLSVNADFGGFAYYSWGAALLAFILYLAI